LPPPGSVWCQKISLSLENNVMTQHIHSRTAEKIEEARADGRTAFIGYLPAGYPSIDASIEPAVALGNNGANVIDIALPYSDPVSDGEASQTATSQSLQDGLRVGDVFHIVNEITSRSGAAAVIIT